MGKSITSRSCKVTADQLSQTGKVSGIALTETELGKACGGARTILKTQHPPIKATLV